MNKKKTLLIVLVAALLMTGVMMLLIFLPKGTPQDGGSDGNSSSADGSSAVSGSDAQSSDTAETDPAEAIDEGAEAQAATDGDGVHQMEIARDKDGNIKENGYGTLMEYIPADISTIHVENAKGSFDVLSETPEGKSNEYTLKGYEEFALQGGVPDTIASAAASLKFSQIAATDDGKNTADFGFDKPRAVVTVTYDDKTKAVITVGSDAPQSAGTYIQFGSGKEIYVVDTATVSVFEYGVTDLVSLTINDAATKEDDNSPQSVKVSGTAYPEAITMEPNTEGKLSASYFLTEPFERCANENESSLIAGGIRGLYADKVVMVNPSDSQLEKLGLLKPYARVQAEYPDKSFDIISAKPESDGSVKIMENGGKIVYSISSDKVPWTKTSYERLCGEYVLYPKMTALSGIAVSGKKNGTFKLKSREVTTTDNSGNESTQTKTTVYLNNEEVQLGDFQTFYDDISLMKLADVKTEKPSGKAALTIAYTYADDGDTDVVELYAGDSRYIAVVNGEVLGHVAKGEVTRAEKELASIG